MARRSEDGGVPSGLCTFVQIFAFLQVWTEKRVTTQTELQRAQPSLI